MQLRRSSIIFGLDYNLLKISFQTVLLSISSCFKLERYSTVFGTALVQLNPEKIKILSIYDPYAPFLLLGQSEDFIIPIALQDEWIHCATTVFVGIKIESYLQQRDGKYRQHILTQVIRNMLVNIRQLAQPIL